MTIALISFPPAAGGNHLRNLLALQYTSAGDLLPTYGPKNNDVISAHAKWINDQVIDGAVIDSENFSAAHGHFGVYMTHREKIKKIKNKKFILITPITQGERQMLNRRRPLVGREALIDGDYHDGEQVFLYESELYHLCFSTPYEDIMNINVSELFTQDITELISRLNLFLGVNVDCTQAQQLHQVWITKNLNKGLCLHE
jgi:hypothetical protein